ncbi:hypothetical protein Mal65_21880 [Crateriforma conspicua]|nr:hypothetical protein Mal65_21880 [Crateriforma conspicua]
MGNDRLNDLRCERDGLGERTSVHAWEVAVAAALDQCGKSNLWPISPLFCPQIQGAKPSESLESHFFRFNRPPGVLHRLGLIIGAGNGGQGRVCFYRACLHSTGQPCLHSLFSVSLLSPTDFKSDFKIDFSIPKPRFKTDCSAAFFCFAAFFYFSRQISLFAVQLWSSSPGRYQCECL